MTRLVITSEWEQDIDSLYLADPDLADAAELLIENLFSDLDILGSLHAPSTYPLYSPVFEVKIFSEAHQDNFNIYILKYRDLNGYTANHRIFLGFNAQLDIYYALAITDRSHAYDTNHPAYRSLCARYEQCRIPKIR